MPHFIVPADAGLALADLSAYQSFVDSVWTLPAVLDRFVQQANAAHLLAWGTGASANWRINVLMERAEQSGFREFSGLIRVTGDGLHLTSYDELTVAAQFRDCRLPRPGTEQWFIPLKRGTYACRVVQLFDPELADSPKVFRQRKPHFIVELLLARTRRVNRFQSVPWFDV